MDLASTKFYAVTCKHGHHGKGRYQPITFAIHASSINEAISKASAMPGVKHDAFVISCSEISAEKYRKLRSVSAYERMNGCL